MPKPKTGEPKDIRDKVIKVFSRDEGDYGISELRVEVWIVNGKASQPRLARREKYVLKSGVEKSGKAKGLSLADFELAVKFKDEIRALLAGRSHVPSAAPAAQPAPTDDWNDAPVSSGPVDSDF